MKKSLLLGAFLMTCITPIQAKLQTAATLQDVQAAIEKVLETARPEDVLVAFDIDQTLVVAKNPVVQMPTFKKYNVAFQEVLKGLSGAQIDWILCFGVHKAGAQLAEPGTVDMVAQLQKEGVKTIAFTARLVAPLKGTKPFILETLDMLQGLGLDFSKTFEQMPSLVLEEMPPLAGGQPTFYRGVLAANGDYGAPEGLSKGAVMVAFLAHLKATTPPYAPKIVILVDDKKSHLESMEAALVAADPTLQFLGLEYLAGREFSSGEVSEDEFRAYIEGLGVPAL